MPTAYHMVNYRRLVPDSAANGFSNLELCCRSVLELPDNAGVKLSERVTDRLHAFNDGGGARQLLLNKVADISSAVFGEMCLIEQKGLQTLLELTKSKVELSDLTTAEIYDLQEREAPDGSQFIRGMCYWLVIGNHLFFVKTHSMLPDHIRRYLEWMLKSNGGIHSNFTFQLQSEFDPSQVAGDIGDIKSVRVKGAAPKMPINVLVADGDEKEVSTSRKVGDKVVEMAQAVPIVQALFGPAKAASLVESLGPREYLAVDASVRVRGRRTEKSKVKLREIVSDLADTTDAEVRVEGKFGRISDGDAILRTRMPFDLPYDGSNLLEFHNVADQLQEVYSRFVRDGKIDP